MTLSLVGDAGIEPATTRSQAEDATDTPIPDKVHVAGQIPHWLPYTLS